MAEKIAVIDAEFVELAAKLQQTQTDLLAQYKKLNTSLEKLVSKSGPVSAPDFSPKVTNMTQAVQTDIIQRLEKTFQQTEEAIQNYESMIMNIDSCC